MKNLKKILPKLIIFIVISIVVIIVLFSLNDITEIGKVLNNVDWTWLSFGFLFLLLYMLFNPLSLAMLGRSKEEGNISFIDSATIGTMEYFFNGITPFSSGGQPFQIYAYNKVGVSLHRSSGIILMNFVVSQISIVLLCLLSLFYFEQLTNGVGYLQVMIVVGLIINVVILTIFCSVGCSKTLRGLLFRFVDWFFNLKIFKGKLVRFITSFESYCEGAQRTFKTLLQQKGKFLLCILAKLLALLSYYSIPFFILRALGIGVTISELPLILAMTTFSIAMTCYIPTPGSAGGIEFAFQSLFVTLLPTISSSIAASGVLLWRLITYYLLMLISFITYLIFEEIIARRYKKHHPHQEEPNLVEDKEQS